MSWWDHQKKFRWKRFLIGFAALYLVAIGLACAFPDHLILFPSHGVIEVPGGSSRMIRTPSGQVQVWIVRTPGCEMRGPRAYVLAFNGNGSRAEYETMRIEPMWMHYAVEIWAMNYPGYGGSHGKALVKNIPPAALAVYDELVKEAHGKPIFVSGHSLGTTAALYIAANRPVAGIVLHNPPPLKQLIQGRFGIYSLWFGAHIVANSIPDELDSLANARRCTAPAVFLLAGKDTLVLPKYQKMVVAAYAGPKRIVDLPTYGHNDAVMNPEITQVQAAVEWLFDYPARSNRKAKTGS